MKRYFSSIKQYAWVIPLCILVAALAGVGLVKSTPVVYQASSIMLVVTNGPNNSISPSISAQDGLSQAINYASQIQSLSTMQVVYASDPRIAKRKYTPQDLLADVLPATSTTAATITLTASTTNAADAVMLANDVAIGFQNYIQQQLQGQLNAERANLNAQLKTYEDQKTYWENQITSINNPADPRVNIYQTNLQDTIHSADTIQSQLLQLPQGVSSNIVVIQKAEPSSVTVSEKGALVVGIAGFLGLLIGVLVMFLLIFLENRLRGEDQVKEKLGLTYLGGVSKNNELRNSPARVTGSAMRQVAAIAANLRLTELLPAQWHAPEGTVLLVTSAQNAEGKTTLVAALASAVARSGANVVVLDGNMRQPGTHLAFAMNPGGPGLSGLLKGVGNIDDAVQRSTVPNVWLLPVGAPLEDSAFLLEQRMPTILAELRKKADLVIIDGAALLSGPEGSVMADMADGVALVIDSKRDKLPILLKTKELLFSLTDTPVGAIMNFQPNRKQNQYYASATKKVETTVESWMLVQAAEASNENGNGHVNGNGNGYMNGNGHVNGNGNSNGHVKKQDLMPPVTPSSPGLLSQMAMSVPLTPNRGMSSSGSMSGLPIGNDGGSFQPMLPMPSMPPMAPMAPGASGVPVSPMPQMPPVSPRPGSNNWLNPSLHSGKDE
jgi:capsular exopolysaccharide synthesis family protein